MSDALEWVLFEALGHRVHYGRMSEHPLAGATFLKVDVYAGQSEEPVASYLYGTGSVYSITPTSEETCRRAGAAWHRTLLTAQAALPAGASDGEDDGPDSLADYNGGPDF